MVFDRHGRPQGSGYCCHRAIILVIEGQGRLATGQSAKRNGEKERGKRV